MRPHCVSSMMSVRRNAAKTSAEAVAAHLGRLQEVRVKQEGANLPLFHIFSLLPPLEV